MMEGMYGHRTAAIYGYSHLTGGIPGGQAEYVRVPFADVNCLVLPEDIPDDKGLYLSDVVPTAYHGTELANVQPGSTVAICMFPFLLSMFSSKFLTFKYRGFRTNRTDGG